jgi:hypothetical protein
MDGISGIVDLEEITVSLTERDRRRREHAYGDEKKK